MYVYAPMYTKVDYFYFFFFQAEDGIRDADVTGVQTCALPISARQLHAMGGQPVTGSVMGPCETLNPEGLALLLELGAELVDSRGDPRAPIALLLETYVRNPAGKHACLDLAAQRGIALPDTPPM